MTEAEFQAQVVEAAELYGWYTHHTFDSRRSNPGFPDLVLVHPKRGFVIFAELKSEKGRVTREQSAWIDALTQAGADAFVWRPADWDQIIERLAP